MFDPSLKKKKKKSKKVEGSEGGAETTASSAGDAAAADSTASSSLSTAPAAGEAAPSRPTLGGPCLGLPGDDELTYDDQLARIYKLLYANNPELLDRTRKKLKPPQVMRVGTTRTAWVNFKEICVTMKRSTEHVMLFFLNELGTTGEGWRCGDDVLRWTFCAFQTSEDKPHHSAVLRRRAQLLWR